MEQFVCVRDFEDHALSILPQVVKDYYRSGEGEETTIKWNREVFKRIKILPRVLRDVSNRDLSTMVLGEKVSMPLGISPTACQKMASENGECANAKVAEAANTIFILSIFSTATIEEVAEAAPRAIKWMQLCIFKDRELMAHTVRKAEKAGFKALVVTVDNPVYGGSKINNFRSCMTNHISKLAIIEDYLSTKNDAWKEYLFDKVKYVSGLLDPSVTWEFIDWLKSITKLPIVLKGILTPKDAILGVKYGASAIFVSNHGGRQFDTVPATIEVLPKIVEAVGDKVEVYLDGGITRGTDVLKALAFGARMVFAGKVMLWGLACGDEEGAASVLRILRQELDKSFALAGCSSVDQVTKDLIAYDCYFRSN